MLVLVIHSVDEVLVATLVVESWRSLIMDLLSEFSNGIEALKLQLAMPRHLRLVLEAYVLKINLIFEQFISGQLIENFSPFSPFRRRLGFDILKFELGLRSVPIELIFLGHQICLRLCPYHRIGIGLIVDALIPTNI
jgi:hypothetical protein